MRTANRLLRRFCSSAPVRRVDRRLVGGLFVLGGVGLAAFLHSRKIEVVEEERQREVAQEQLQTASDPGVAEEAKPEEVEQQKQAEPDEQELLFRKTFLEGNRDFEMQQWAFDAPVDKGEDALLFLVPPKGDPDLFKMVREMFKNLNDLHSISLSKKPEAARTPLKIRWVRIKSFADLERVEAAFGVKLATSEDVPMVVVTNKLRKQPQVVTLMSLFDNEEEFYSQFKPLKKVSADNSTRFKRITSDLDEDELILIQYCAPEDPNLDSFQSNFYEKTMSGPFHKFKAVEAYFTTDLSWAAEHFEDLEPKSGDFFLVQKPNFGTFPRVLAGLKGNKDLLVYKIASEPADSSIKPRDLLRTAAREYYERNACLHLELPTDKKRYTVEFRYDRNKFSQIQIDGGLQVLQKVRELMDEEMQKNFNFAMVPHNFHPTEGKVVGLHIRDNEAGLKRHEYLFENKSRQAARELEQAFPAVTKNDAFEYHFPADFGFTAPSVFEFAKLVQNGTAQDQPVSQLPPRYVRYSRKVTGSTFGDLVKGNPLAHAVFLYSTSCASCKKFTPLYERLARENIEKGLSFCGGASGMMFNRMNKDLNDLPGDKNFDSTPVFLLYRADFKARPFVYKSTLE